MKKLLLASAALAVLSVATPGFVGAASAQTVGDAVALAYSSNPALLAQRATQRALDESIVQAKAGLEPTLSVSANQNYQTDRFNTSGLISNENGPYRGADISLSQPLFTGGRTASAVSVAQANILAGRETLRDTEQQLVLGVVSAHVAVRRDLKLLEVARGNQALLQKQFDDTDARLKLRNATATDLAQARSRLLTAQSGVASAQGQLDISRTIYLNIIGQNPGTLSPEPALPIPAMLDDALAQSEQNSPSLGAARYREIVSERQVSQARNEFGPSVSLNVTGTAVPDRTPPYSNDINQQSLVARLVVTQPLLSSGINASRVRQAKERNTADESLVNNEKRAVTQAVTQAWAQVASSRTVVGLSRQSVASLQIAYEAATLELRAGTRTTLDVLNQAQELQIAQQTLAQAEANEYLARLALLRAMGTLDPRLFANDVTLYNPNVHYDAANRRFVNPLQPVLRSLDELVSARSRDTDTVDPGAAVKPIQSQTLPPDPGRN